MSGPEYNKFEKDMLAKIEEYGWFAMQVFDPDGKDEPFTYSIGLTQTLNSPELIVFGLPKALMHDMLWQVFRQIKAGASVEHGKRWADIIEGYECVTVEATHPDLFKEYATSANWFWKDRGNEGHPPVFQLVWPGTGHRLFPWDEGCSQDVIDAQPKLWRD